MLASDRPPNTKLSMGSIVVFRLLALRKDVSSRVLIMLCLNGVSQAPLTLKEIIGLYMPRLLFHVSLPAKSPTNVICPKMSSSPSFPLTGVAYVAQLESEYMLSQKLAVCNNCLALGFDKPLRRCNGCHLAAYCSKE